jgi:DNA-binding transcriptional MerR regulator
MKIGELAEATGLPASTIRYWERIGVLPRPARASGQRDYRPDALYRVAVLKLAQSCGFDLDEMRRLLHGFRPNTVASERWRELGRRKRQDLDCRIARLEAMRDVLDRVLGCRCPDLAECGRRAAAGQGVRLPSSLR